MELRDPLARLRAIPWAALAPTVDAACQALGPVLAGVSVERALDRLLRAHPALSREERQALVEAVFGVALWRRRLTEDFARTEPRVLLMLLLRDLGGLDEQTARGVTRLHGPAPAEADGQLGLTIDPADKNWQQRWSMPGAIANELVRALGEQDAARFAQAVCAPGPVTLRTNTLRTTRDRLMDSLRAEGRACEPAPFAPQGVRVTSARPNLLGTQASKAAWFEAQDEGSQLLGALVQARPGERVLDACAGAGGKSLQLACEVGTAGRVFAADVDATRLLRLGARAKAAGASMVELVSQEALETLEVDCALVDAPCSELGPLRRGPDARWRLDARTFGVLPALQLEILQRAARCVRAGGRLVYATCTVRREENEEVAIAFERAQPRFQRVRPAAATTFIVDGADTQGPVFRALPHLHDTDGFFAAVWHKS
ncbi:MAG: RsmB/NOP family class I SAM-dependent RNA methyltransferase [Deltaproteobacteria bacterium]|nr:RsmB/NOP family class I SAM-dependent RNA methyltransferase [Deltaproteobacteria bacterium]